MSEKIAESAERSPRLLPCPFCGGAAAIQQTGPAAMTVLCVEPQWSGLTGCGLRYQQKHIHHSLEWLEETLTVWWNRRASQLGTAALDIVAERDRQLQVEGWTPEHDDQHNQGDLSKAAACYAWSGSGNHPNTSLCSMETRWFDPSSVKHVWPWEDGWWKPTDRRRDLVKAGALIIAEIDRLDRAGGQS